MQSNEELKNKIVNQEKERIEHLYDNCPDRKPPFYRSNAEALSHVREKAQYELREAMMLNSRKTKLDIGDAAKIIAENIAFTTIYDRGNNSLAIYDYDRKIYTFNTNTILNDCVVKIMGVSSQNIINSVVTTLIGMREKSAIYNPLPRYKIAVGNGIFNCLTNELEEFTPEYTVLTKISTNYIENAERPRYRDHFTLESMIRELANGESERVKLLGQIVKAILTEHSLKPGLFIILGSGGDGKSTFFTMISNMIGQDNVAYVNFGELNSPDKMAETINKKLVLGLDNDVKIYLRKTALLKSMASHETITFSRKYMNAISVPFTGSFVQLCNEMPRMAESGSSMRRRLVSFKAENSHYESGTENDNVDTVYIKDQQFLEYALWFFLNEETNPYYSDFNDFDRQVVNESLDAEDVLSQFLSEASQIGVLGDINPSIPSSHLYAAYQDWMNINNPGSKVLSARGFSLQVTPKLKDYGYETQSGSNMRPQSLENSELYSSLTWGVYKDRPNLENAINMNAPSKVFKKVAPAKDMSVIRRKSYKISALRYFNIIDKDEDFDPDSSANQNIQNESSDLSLSSLNQISNERIDQPEDNINEREQRGDNEQMAFNHKIRQIEQIISRQKSSDLRLILQNNDAARLTSYYNELNTILKMLNEGIDLNISNPSNQEDIISLKLDLCEHISHITQSLNQYSQMSQDLSLALGSYKIEEGSDVKDVIEEVIDVLESKIDEMGS